MSVVALASAFGVLVIAAVDTAGRLGYASSDWANRAYWLGQALIVVPPAARLLSRRALMAWETVTLVTVFSFAEYLVTVCYSPAGFTYGDELMHWRTTVNILQTGKLFTNNYLLPISPHYPGLEEVTAATVSVTGLPVFIAGLIVAGIAHLLFVFILYILFRELTGSYRVAGVAVLLYAGNSHFGSFDSMFIYQTFALPFLGLALLTTWRLSSRPAAGQRTGWLAVALLAIVVTVVSHHVTSYVLVASLLVVALAGVITRRWRVAAWAAVMAIVSAAAVGGWVASAAPETLAYLRPFFDSIVQSVHALFAAGHGSAPPLASDPLSDRAMAAAGVLTISAPLPVGWWVVWRRHRRSPWLVAMAIVSACWYLVVSIRLVVADGSELAGRAATFIFVPMACILALAVGQLAAVAVRRRAPSVGLAVLAVVLVIIFDGMINGWPPFWERLPGPHQIAGFERSVGPQEIAVANWSLAELGPGNRFAADFGNFPILGSYGDQNPELNDGFLYDTADFTSAEAQEARALSIRYLLIDLRLSRSLPASGQYFPIDANVGKYLHPLPIANLTKFNRAPGIARIYDNGTIIIYDLDGEHNGT